MSLFKLGSVEMVFFSLWGFLPVEPFFALFTSSDCKRCAATEEIYNNVSSLFPRTLFTRVDCSSWKSLCKSFRVSGVPYIGHFHPNWSLISDFCETKKLFRLLRWVESESGVRSVYSSKHVINSNSLDIHDSDGCTVDLFYLPWCRFSREMLDIQYKLTKIYEGDNVEFRRIDCTVFSSACSPSEVGVIPTFKVRNNKTSGTAGHATNITDVIRSINRVCKLRRDADGLIVEDFSEQVKAILKFRDEGVIETDDDDLRSLLVSIDRINEISEKIEHHMRVTEMSPSTRDRLRRRRSLVKLIRENAGLPHL